jgi:hypothetical protein
MISEQKPQERSDPQTVHTVSTLYKTAVSPSVYSLPRQDITLQHTNLLFFKEGITKCSNEINNKLTNTSAQQMFIGVCRLHVSIH